MLNMLKTPLSHFRAALFALLVGFASLAPQPVQAQAFSDYLENRIIDLIVRGQAFTAPASVWVGLATGSGCTDAGFGGNEVLNSNNYSRVQITSNLTNWLATQGGTVASTGTGGQTSNAVAVNFPTPSGSWGTVTYWFLADSGTHNSGNLLICDDLNTPQAIGSGNTVSFAIGALTITVQ
jgi:hypothetical protein